MFDRLVTASVSWSMGTMQISRSVLQLLRVQHTTLIIWLMGLGVHRSWYDVQMLAWVRQVAKAWIRVYLPCTWDVLCLRRVWRLLGHSIRARGWPYCMLQQVTHSQSVSLQMRRHRTGPDNSHYRIPLRFVHKAGHSITIADNRPAWQALENKWVEQWIPAPVASGGGPHQPNVLQVPCSHWQVLDKRALQGFIHGATTVFLCQTESMERWLLLSLFRREGWQVWSFHMYEYACLATLLHKAVTILPQQMLDQCFFLRLYILHHSSQIQEDSCAFQSFRDSTLEGQRNPIVLYFSSECPSPWIPLVMEAAAQHVS